uniref:MARVEL domain-containing protein n=1 Tax=Mesocestoides corti TaxID=53468 RepID=A0A5K3EKU3_MESCO
MGYIGFNFGLRLFELLICLIVLGISCIADYFALAVCLVFLLIDIFFILIHTGITRISPPAPIILIEFILWTLMTILIYAATINALLRAQYICGLEYALAVVLSTLLLLVTIDAAFTFGLWRYYGSYLTSFKPRIDPRICGKKSGDTKDAPNRGFYFAETNTQGGDRTEYCNEARDFPSVPCSQAAPPRQDPMQDFKFTIVVPKNQNSYANAM